VQENDHVDYLNAALALLPPTLKVEVSTGGAVLAVVALGLWAWSRRGRPD
jgi:hypothetical protein